MEQPAENWLFPSPLFLKLNELPVIGQAGPYRPLRGVFEGNRGTEEGHDSVTGKLINCTRENSK